MHVDVLSNSRNNNIQHSRLLYDLVGVRSLVSWYNTIRRRNKKGERNRNRYDNVADIQNSCVLSKTTNNNFYLSVKSRRGIQPKT